MTEITKHCFSFNALSLSSVNCRTSLKKYIKSLRASDRSKDYGQPALCRAMIRKLWPLREKLNQRGEK